MSPITKLFEIVHIYRYQIIGYYLKERESWLIQNTKFSLTIKLFVITHKFVKKKKKLTPHINTHRNLQ